MPKIGLTINEWNDHIGQNLNDAKNVLLDYLDKIMEKHEAWIYYATPEQIISQFDSLLPSLRNSASNLPLFGVPFAVKDNIDVAGWPTTAACPSFSYIAEADATVVSRLKAAGAIVVGKTNLDQFATGSVGTRSPFGIVKNSFNPQYISGGSSSGSAWVVANGLVPFALGTDTAGSGRIPAAFNNIVGLKPTKGWLSTKGVVPACCLNDTVSVFALTVEDAFTVATLAAAPDPDDCYSRTHPATTPAAFQKIPVLAIPDKLKFFGDQLAEAAWLAALQKMNTLGVEIKTIDFSPFYQLAEQLYGGAWIAERTAALGDILNHATHMDPIVHSIVMEGTRFTAVEAWKAEYQRAQLVKHIQSILAEVDALLVPTSSTIRTIKEIQEEPIQYSSQLGIYASCTNLADLSALALPAPFRADGLPAGISLLALPWHDRALANFGQHWQKHLALPLGAISRSNQIKFNPLIPSLQHIQIAIPGNYSVGTSSLHTLLRSNYAVLIKETTTAPHYNLHAVCDGFNKIPALTHSNVGSTIAVELWEIPLGLFGQFVAEIPPPLGLGSVTLSNGEVVKGIIFCQLELPSDAVEITEAGSWSNWLASCKSSPKKFTTVLIANRGEIACRAIRTLKHLGIRSVAIYSDSDRNALHVKNADVAIALAGDKVNDTYTNIEKILAAAKTSAAQAIWPGYGFLSESQPFADACEKAGIVFIGPTPQQIREFGLKHRARELATEAGLPISPGTPLLNTIEEALEAAKKIGYPVMLKSTAGGGGIGMTRCANESELQKAWENVRHLSEQFFGNADVFIERCIDHARHIEVQIFGDGNGKVVALGERDCSLQRRNQKVIEETPAPNLPKATRDLMLTASVQLGKLVKYRSAGTVEYIYDASTDVFYFLEVNTRLQVEHAVTEYVTGIDLVACMIQVAAGDSIDWSSLQKTPTGASIEVRLYAEDPIKNFQPCPGLLTQVIFPKGENVRIDSGVETGSDVSPHYDPMIAKLIVYGETRDTALQQLQDALSATQLHGITTNLDYLRQIVETDEFQSGNVWTGFLNNFTATSAAIEVLQPGTLSTIQDYPGRIGYWDVGVPPSGPMDDFAFRLANRIVGNHESAAGLEFTLQGPTLKFREDAIISLTGGYCAVELDGNKVEYWQPISIKTGQTLKVGRAQSGCRTYLAIRNGFDVPEYLGSRSTFTLGQFGGHAGRTLRVADVLPISQPQLTVCTTPAPISSPQALDEVLIPIYGNIWTIKVLYGPHGAPDFLTQDSIDEFFATDWQVHYNSNRLGIRLIGPKPSWTRANGGEAGLHPSNIHDCMYAMGSVNFTGDFPVILTHDGPSLGGFVCPVTIAKAELWKVGQVKPGDHIRFHPISVEEALALEQAQTETIETLLPVHMPLYPSPSLANTEFGSAAILALIPGTATTPKAVYRQAGDNYILIEYGEYSLDLALRLRVYLLMNALHKCNVPGIAELSPGVISLQVHYNSNELSQSKLMTLLLDLEKTLGDVSRLKVPSRILWMPMAFEDSAALGAVQRYRESVRATAPWLPNNVDFLQRINGLPRREIVSDIIYAASWLVLGLGDVYLGASCAVPVDPRHRLLSSKYSPARTFTAEGTVGVGGMYLSIYGMDSPGGYQLVGRTLPIWNRFMQNPQFVDGKPWLLRFFDQIRFYPVSETELTQLREDFRHGRTTIRIEETLFDFVEYQHLLKDNASSIEKFRQFQAVAFEAEVALWAQEEQNNPEPTGKDNSVPEVEEDENALPVQADMNGNIWKVLVKSGDIVEASQTLVIVEAMKMELAINAPQKGRVKRIVCQPGHSVSPGDTLLWLE
ncbi:uncharacterized protein LOC135838952 [Planococcus citri]|uniref:Urea amidolyase n=1 Tax=Planococcus citri TaxID=170843 RepID=S5N940_9HEMI|nr:urea amidolyase [Planococcus citri]